MWWGTPQHVSSRRAEAAEAERMAAAVPSLGPTPMDLDVKQTGSAENLSTGLRSLLASKECCDLVFVAGDEHIEAHAVVLAASSSSFYNFLRRNPALGKAAPTEGSDEMQELFSMQTVLSAA
ncbi:unnamed protein product [Effrenium voratum]|nr:unnamed protein product [Effrenium voratum]